MMPGLRYLEQRLQELRRYMYCHQSFLPDYANSQSGKTSFKDVFSLGGFSVGF